MRGIFICKKDIFPKTVMQFKFVYAAFLMFLLVVKVQCEIRSSQINYETYEEYTHCKVNFFIRELWSYAGCMEHCKNLGGRAVPVRTPQEWKEMDEVFKDLQNYTSTATSRPTRPNGWISIHVVGNLSSMDGIPTTRWKSIQWMEIPLGVGWISHHLPPKWMDGNPTILEPKPGLKFQEVL